MNSDICNSPSYLTLTFIKHRNNVAFNVSHPKGLIFLTRLRVSLRHLREHKFKHNVSDALIPICICDVDIETLIQFFIHYPRFLMKGKTFCLRMEGSSPTFLEKPSLLLHQYFYLGIQIFPLILKSTYSIHLLTTYYSRFVIKDLNLLFLQRLDR